MKTLCAVGICARDVLILRLTVTFFCAFGTQCFYYPNVAIYFMSAVGKGLPNRQQLCEVVPQGADPPPPPHSKRSYGR
jgi:hypothetical protein